MSTPQPSIPIANWDTIPIGAKATHSKTITETDITLFTAISGDFNPIHVNDSYAKTTVYGRRIAHGIISVSLIAGLLGMKLPGAGTVHVSQNVDFKKPVFIGDTLTARGEVVEKFKKRDGTLKFIRIKTQVFNQENILVTDGEALVLVP
jgi:3-hydroxybutyryl-CoA dehydratase